MNTASNGQESNIVAPDFSELSEEARIVWGRKVAALRDERGMTAVELSHASGVDRKTLRTMERGERAAQASKLDAVYTALGVPQRSDPDQHWADKTRMFINCAAPVFDGLPDSEKDAAHDDVIGLLQARLIRSRMHVVSGSVDDLETATDTEVEEARQLGVAANKRESKIAEQEGE